MVFEDSVRRRSPAVVTVASKAGYLQLVIGTLLAFGGTVQVLLKMGATTDVVMWGVVVIVGLLVLSRGIVSVMTATESSDAAEPEQAVGKTDSRFGRR